jgi:hypothetical protein
MAGSPLPYPLAAPAFWKMLGATSDASMAITTITTRISMRVNPSGFGRSKTIRLTSAEERIVLDAVSFGIGVNRFECWALTDLFRSPSGEVSRIQTGQCGLRDMLAQQIQQERGDRVEDTERVDQDLVFCVELET